MKTSRGRPRKPPEEKTSQLAIRLLDSDREALRHLAEDAGMSMSAYIVSILKAHIGDGT